MVWVLGLVAATGGSACGDDDDGGNGGGAASCVDYGSVDLMACGGPCALDVIVKDVFQGACALSGSCHSSSVPNPLGGFGLGPQMGDATADEIAKVYATLVNQPSQRSKLELVAPSDPASSWLLAKVEYKFAGTAPATGCAAVDASCDPGTAPGKCGTCMPQGQCGLDAVRLGKLRAWIAGGAQQ